MGQTIHRNFKQASDAQAAQNELLAAGFRPAAVKLNSHQIDPATLSSSANFVENVIDEMTPGGAPATSATAKPASLLSVDTDDDDQQARAAAIMARHGATDA